MKTNSAYYINLITRYLLGESTPEEIRELEVWINTDPANKVMFSEYQKTWKTIENNGIEASVNLDNEWKKLVPRLKIKTEDLQNTELRLQRNLSESVNLNSKFLYWSLRIAAIFLMIAIPSFFLYQYFSGPSERKVTASGGIIEQALPDGTIVTLNAGASLSYPSAFEGPFRKVTLKGEAWFEVAHDKARPFIVAVEDVRIRVVGTSFFVNSKTFGNTKEIILSSGIVKVYYENSPENTAFLFPGDKAELTSGSHAIMKTTNEDVNFLSWKTKRLIFNNTPLNEVAALLTKVYHTSIRLSDDRISDCRITTTFDRQSLESVLNVLSATLDLQVRNTGTGFDLSGNGCNQDK